LAALQWVKGLEEKQAIVCNCSVEYVNETVVYGTGKETAVRVADVKWQPCTNCEKATLYQL